MSSKKIVAQNLERLIAKSQIGKNAIADLAGVSRSHLFSVLAEEMAPTIDWLERLAAALGVEVWELLRPRR